jgi:hypothetical protein
MKLLLQPNLIRLRLNRSEVETLIKENAVEEVVALGADQVLRYCLQVSHNITAPQASFKMGEVLIKVPYERATHWALSSEINVEGTQVTDGQSPLRILLEKDFANPGGSGEPNAQGFKDC